MFEYTNWIYYLWFGLVRYEDETWRKRTYTLEIYCDNGFGELILID